MGTKREQPTDKPDTEPERKADRSPQGDLRKMLDLGRSARAKLIRAGNEESAGRVLNIIHTIERELDPADKEASAS